MANEQCPILLAEDLLTIVEILRALSGLSRGYLGVKGAGARSKLHLEEEVSNSLELGLGNQTECQILEGFLQSSCE